MTIQGAHDGYFWLWSLESRLSDVLRAVPDLVLGQVVAVTAFDSGPFRPSAAECAAGWSVERNVAFSPPIRDVRELPLGEWDEWYVSPDRRIVSEVRVFVNDGGFTPNPQPPLRDLEPTWDRLAASEEQRQSMKRTEWFWNQLRAVQPAAFLAEGDALTCVIASETLFARVLAAVERQPDND